MLADWSRWTRHNGVKILSNSHSNSSLFNSRHISNNCSILWNDEKLENYEGEADCFYHCNFKKTSTPFCKYVVVELQELENLSAILGQKFFYFLSLLSCLKIINGFENSSPECVFSSMTPLVEQSEAEPTECMYIFAQKTCRAQG